MTAQGGALRSAWLRAPPQNRRAILPMCYGTHFTAPGNVASAAPLIKEAIVAGETFRAHSFESACARNDVEHRLTCLVAERRWDAARWAIKVYA